MKESPQLSRSCIYGEYPVCIRRVYGVTPYGMRRIVQSALPTRLGGVFEDLLGVDVHLPQKRGRDGVAIAFIGQDGGAALQAQRREDGFRNPVGQAVERADDNDPIIALAVASARGRYGLSKCKYLLCYYSGRLI
jgi:hypothetical protein